MPIKIYSPIDEVSSQTATLRSYSGACTTAGSSTISQTSSNVRQVRRQHATGWTIPGWSKIKNDGRILPFTRWDRFSLSAEVQEGHREWCASPTGARQKWSNLYRGMDNLDLSSSYLRSLVDLSNLQYPVQKAAAKIASSGFDALTFLAEARQLQKMFSGVVDKFRRLSQGEKVFLTWKRASNYWLEGRYGWRTLLYDVVDLHAAITSANDRRTRYRQASGLSISGSELVYSESTSNGIISGFSTDISWTGNLRGTVVADIEVPAFQFNPVTTAWELTRLSFVVDWLLNVGQALDAATFLVLAKSYQAGVGYKVDFNLDFNIVNVGKTGTTIVHANDGSGTGSASLIFRAPATVSIAPRVKLRLDSFKAVDLLALVYQQLIKRR